MSKSFVAIMLAASFALAPSVEAADAKAKPVPVAAVKAGKGEKVCRVKMQYSGEVKSWTCKTAEPCCVWHEINYVKCGSTITGCL